MTNNFCAEPWKQIFIGPDSKIKTCCAGRVNLGDLQQNTIEEILKGDELLDIKNTILKGEWHKNCGLCKELEDRGVESQRHRTQEEFKNHAFYKDNILYHTPDMLDVRWDNTCNLACNYCMPYFSSVWASIKKEYQTPPRNNDGVMSYIKDKAEEIRHVLCLGGEPFLQKRNIELLENLNSDCSILFLTNLSTQLEGNPIYEKLKCFKYVTFHLSFETVGKKFEYVRHNASWDKFSHNLSLIKKEFPNSKIVARPLYCVYSAFNLEEYYDFIEKNNIEVGWQKIEGPVELNVNYLPKKFRILAIEEINKVLLRNGKNLDLDTLSMLKNSLLKDDSEIQKDQIRIFHENLENIYHAKKYKFVELWPHLQELV
jgi:organic radical activating enzyme